MKKAKAVIKKKTSKKEMPSPKIEVYNIGEKTVQVLIHNTETDEFLDFLVNRDRNVLSVFYGAFNECDLITYEI